MKPNYYAKMSRKLKVFWEKVSTCILIGLVSLSFILGQTLQDDRELELVIETSHTERVESVAISQNRKLLASTGGNIIIRDATNGKFVKQLGGEENQGFVVFSPDGTILASCDERKLTLWNIDTGKPQKIWNGEFYGVNQIAFSPNGKILATTNFEGSITIWDIEKGRINKFRAHDTALSVAFSPDGSVLATSGEDKEFPIKIWDVKTWKLLRSLKGHQENNLGAVRVWSVEFSPDGKTIATSSFDNTVKLWNWNSSEILQTFQGHSDLSRAIAFSPDGQILATSGDGHIKLWNTKTGELVIPLGEKQSKKFPDAVLSLKFSSDGKTLISCNTDSYTASDAGFNFWDIKTGKLIQTFASKRIFSVTPSSDGNNLAINFGAEIKLLDLANIQSVKTLKGHSKEIWEVSISPDGRTLASASADKTIKLWDVLSGNELSTIKGHSEEVRAVAFSPDGKILASGSRDNTIKIWNVNNNLEIKTLQQGNLAEKFDNQVMSVVFSPDGKLLASGSWRKVQIWDVISGANVKTLPVDSGWIRELKFSPDGKILMARSRDEIDLFDLTTNVEFKPENLPEWVTSNIFTLLNGKKMKISTEGSTLKLLNYSDSKEIVKIALLEENNWAVITPNGRFDASEGAMNLMHYTFGLEIINLEQLKETYYAPGLLQILLGFSNETLLPVEPLKDIKLYPEIIEQKFDSNTGKLNFKLKNRGGGIGKIEVFVNGIRIVADTRDENLKRNPIVALNQIISLTVDLPATSFLKGVENQIKIITSNYIKEKGKGNIQSRGTEIVYIDPVEELSLPNFYAIVGGVSDYAGKEIDLRFAAEDAEKFSNALRLGANRLFCPSQSAECMNKINITTLSTAREKLEEQPTKENFKKAFADIAAKAKPEDILVVYLSGHGATLKRPSDTYFYLTKEARSLETTYLDETFQNVAISNEEVTDWLTPNTENPNDIFIKAQKRVIIIDTCAAGNFAKNEGEKGGDNLTMDQIRAIEFLNKNTGTIIIMGSTGNRRSYEIASFNGGLLTYALLEGMQGSGLQKPTDNIDVRLLFEYAAMRVPQLAKIWMLEQRPIIKQPAGNNFIIGQMTNTEKQQISLPQPKPLMLRPLLTNSETDDDDLDLIPQLGKMLDAESSYDIAKKRYGAEPIWVYRDNDIIPGGLKITGKYTFKDENVTLIARLRRDNKTIHEFPAFVGKKDEVINKLIIALRKQINLF